VIALQDDDARPARGGENAIHSVRGQLVSEQQLLKVPLITHHIVVFRRFNVPMAIEVKRAVGHQNVGVQEQRLLAFRPDRSADAGKQFKV
jgi:hypothetical protein